MSVSYFLEIRENTNQNQTCQHSHVSSACESVKTQVKLQSQLFNIRPEINISLKN